MSMYYSHLLIPTFPDSVPTVQSIQAFLNALNDAGYVPQPFDVEVMEVQRVAATSRTFANPFTGESMVFTSPTRKIGRRQTLTSVDGIAAAVEDLDEYDIELAGEGPPSRPPLPLEFAGNYHLAISCHVRSAPVSTSDLHEESAADRTAIPFDEPFARTDRIGLFSDPTTLAIIEVPDAGSARFWIAIGLGKSLFPPITQGNLEILDTCLVTLTKNHFGMPFSQGCLWG